jgi:phosphohistidine phosphatase
VICSTATRTRETWQLASTAFGTPPRVLFDERIYRNDPRILLEIVKATKANVHALLLIGHNPSMQMFAI